MFIQEIQEENWDEILHIQEEAYQEIAPEELSVLKEKQECSPSTCLVAVSETNEVQAYLLAHPWFGKEPPKLFKTLPKISEPDSLYLHDMAISSRSRGMGLGGMLLKHLLSITQHQRVRKITLVAVQDSYGFWAKHGFEVVINISVDSSYGDGAILMEMSLPA